MGGSILHRRGKRGRAGGLGVALAAAGLLALCAAPARALDTTLGPDGLGAPELGAGGAAVAVAQGPDGLYWNPAARLDGPWTLAYNGGIGGPGQSVQDGLAVAGPLDEGQGLSGGLLLGDDLYPQAGDYHEDSAAADLALALGPWVRLGTQQRLDLANPGGLAVWSMDLGAQAEVPLGGTWALDLGAAGTDLSSYQSGPGAQQPAVLRAGAALSPLPGDWLAFEEDQEQSPGSDGPDQWRAGGQVSLFGRRLDLRLGATQVQGECVYYTAGAGARWSALDGLEGDYAVLIPASAALPQRPRQVFSLAWRFGPSRRAAPPASAPTRPASLGAGLGRSLRDARGRLRWARLVLSAGPVRARSWSLSLLDAHGRVLKVFRGKGPLPRGLEWDGRDAQGLAVESAGLSFALRVTDASGAVHRVVALLAPVAETGLEAGSGAGGDEFALRGASPSPLRPVLALRGVGALSVAGADFDLAAVPGSASAVSWELRIVDASGRVVRVLHGLGRPPKSVRWEGDDDLGRPVPDSLGDGFELRLTDASGSERVAAAGPLADQAAFSLALASVSPAPAVPRAVFTAGSAGRRFTFYFAPGSADLTPSDQALLAKAAGLIRAAGLRSVGVLGYSGDEGAAAGPDLAQQRADAVLRDLLGLGLDLDQAVARPGSPDAAAPGRGPAYERRVELSF